jgi:hypothetical protein
MANQFRSTIIMQRPNTSVEYPLVSEELNNYHQITYRNTGKILAKTSHRSKDQLTLVTVITFASQEDYEEFRADSIVRDGATIRDQYLADNGFTLTILLQLLDDTGHPLTTQVMSKTY